MRLEFVGILVNDDYDKDSTPHGIGVSAGSKKIQLIYFFQEY